MPAPTQIYKETAKIVANPREVEANLLFQSASRLQAIADHWDGKAAELRDALLYNRRLWTIFLASVTQSAMPNWLAPTITAIKNQAHEGGLLGMLDSAGGDGSIGSFLSKSSATAGSFAAISQNSVTNASSLVAQIASQNI